MSFKTLCYIANLALGLVVRESIDHPLQCPAPSTMPGSRFQTVVPSPILQIPKNKTPMAWIFAPDVKGKYFEVFGYGEDNEEGSIPDQWYCWEIELHHRKKIIETSMIQGTKSFMLDFSDKRPLNHDWYRVRLSISDTHGSIGKDSVDLYPTR